MFEHVGDYMYYLLHGPLKRGQQLRNQFYVFFGVIGRLFDRLKSDIFRVHEEGMVLTASDTMLAAHGQDREMPRLKGEDAETYRMRLVMASITAELAGTYAGELAVLVSMGLTSSTIEPYYLRDPERWAEFIVWIRPPEDGELPPIILANLNYEVRRVKEIGAKPNYGLAPAAACAHVVAWCKYGLHVHVGPKGDS